MMTLSQSSGGTVISPRSIVISGWRLQRRGHGGRKAVAVDRQRAAGRHLIGVGRLHDQRAEPAHFLVQQADGIVVLVVGAEGIGADQFGQAIGLVGGGFALWPHLVQGHRDAGFGELPGGFGTGQAAADNMNGLSYLPWSCGDH